MLLAQVFKTMAGAQKRARFETAHSPDRRFVYSTMRCIHGLPDPEPWLDERYPLYTWRLRRETRS